MWEAFGTSSRGDASDPASGWSSRVFSRDTKRMSQAWTNSTQPGIFAMLTTGDFLRQTNVSPGSQAGKLDSGRDGPRLSRQIKGARWNSGFALSNTTTLDSGWRPPSNMVGSTMLKTGFLNATHQYADVSSVTRTCADDSVMIPSPCFHPDRALAATDPLQTSALRR
jgi:hypothetical protein